ncbi:MAG: pre-peptidase C-terminal domain-containing protein [Cyanomargarita calcarea GSE-NOS-MK-12-04C]|jgi:uncharacterized protein YkwD|uniref:Pre-peptidase C-terminal domain-containing protein n=1 Tax=Cyanomargarita calcarea GSE-NOS-MK-12-04C TaxID=2839659 RepID=A0A951UTJ8_9CYAN|nr:pre-peptidase C-terminal domain-containing protein [Cyanomargarita calcarea GSE-NOS-MK-12-04C]
MPVNLFDANYYRAANSDLRGYSDTEALSHFQNLGLDEGRSFSPFVDLSFYRSSNSDLTSYSNREAYEHLSNSGVTEGRRFSAIFDLKFYKNHNNDLVSLDNEQLFDHLRTNGVTEGRQFSQFFDINFYGSDNPDVAQANGGSRLGALNDFALSGLNQGRRFSNAFDVNYYRNTNPDLAAANLTNKQLLEHFEIYGVNEGRVSAESFDVKFYLNSNPDLEPANFNYSQAYEDFVTDGLPKGRIASRYINSDYAGNELSAARNIGLDSKTVIFRDSVGNADTSDFYQFTLGSQNNFNLTLNGLSADADVELLNNAGQVVASAANGGMTSESLTVSNLQAGTFYIRVYQGVGGGDTNYNMSLSAIPVPATIVSAAESAAPESALLVSPTPQSATPASSGNYFIDRVIELTNAERAKAGLKPVSFNSKLSSAAQAHSEEMATCDYFSHTGTSGCSVSDRVQNCGYEYSYVGENIAAGYVTPEEVVQGWMSSPGHRANILNANYQEVGIGYHYLENDMGNVNYNYYWTQDFGSTLTT